MGRKLEQASSGDLLLKTGHFIDAWYALFEEEEDYMQHYLLRLVLHLYSSHKQKQSVHMMDACQFIPVKHAMSAKKYISYAEKKGWVEFLRDRDDRRKTIVRATPMLIQLLRELWNRPTKAKISRAR